jgi:hypothetical protein
MMPLGNYDIEKIENEDSEKMWMKKELRSSIDDAYNYTEVVIVVAVYIMVWMRWLLDVS